MSRHTDNDHAVQGDDEQREGLTIGAVARRTGVTVRTLHHWEAVGLVSASERSPAGYRLYTAADAARIHRALIYRELGLPLERIREVLDSGAAPTAQTLRDQRNQLDERISELQRMRHALDRMIEVIDAGLPLTADEQIRIFGDDWNPDWTRQAREKWGDSKQWTQYAERAVGRDLTDWEQIAEQTHALDATLASACARGVLAGSSEANALVDAHRESMNRYFECTISMQVCIGHMYANDPGFRAHFDGAAPGLAVWLRDAIDANARAHGIDPETATWE
ncbi:MerR family transcriptional regulator [Microbacterium sp. MPKO10]|uniref:MerR family transcriptional regulator n=1 Tax=Microbacterium sp. MPKO10 TaxID=2989818 RepID=UPI0022367687|nr:MerR family transcriptional regulator [Microbacterium sp. MPKO10]MCW4457194.1 MerR family transcriptional regulator [Microbacterium sp. MPKO10]